MSVVFLLTQGFAQAHEVAHGDEDHSHDGVACEINLVAVEQINIAPPLPVFTPFKFVTKLNWITPLESGRPNTFDSRAPPPRGPPAL